MMTEHPFTEPLVNGNGLTPSGHTPAHAPLRHRLGEIVALQRRRRGLTQAELADAAGLSLKYLGEVERGEANVTIDVLERVANALGWDPNSLFAIEPPPIDERLRNDFIGEVNTLREAVDRQIAQLLQKLDAVSTTSRMLQRTLGAPNGVAAATTADTRTSTHENLLGV